MKDTIFILITLLAILFIIDFVKQELHETPNERVERVNRNADRECSKYKEAMARNCFTWYYESIEDRS